MKIYLRGKLYKRIAAVFVILILLLCLPACSSSSLYNNNELGLAFAYPSKYGVITNESSVTLDLTDNVRVAVFSYDVTQAADEKYLEIYSEEELGLHSGAFEANYNNTLFVSQMFDYILSDSQREYSVYGVRKDKFGAYDAWCATFSSSDGKTNGYVYLCVENLRSYITVIYVKDTDIHTDHKKVDKFINSFSILKGN